MNQKKKRPAAPVAPSVDNPGTLPAEVMDPNAQRVQRMKAADEAQMFQQFRDVLGTDATITLHRWHPNSGQTKPGYVGTIVRDDFNYETVADRFGGGDFVARAKVNGGHFDGSERKFTIDHSIPPKNPRAAGEQKNSEVAEVVRAMREDSKAAQSQATDLLKTMLLRPQAESGGQMLEMFKFLSEQNEKSAAALRELIAANQQQTNRILEKLAARDLAPGTGEPPKSILEQVREAKELLDELGVGNGAGGEGDWKKELVVMAREALPILGQVLTTRGVPSGPLPRVQITPQRPTAPAGLAAPGETAAGPSTTQQTEEEMNILIRTALAGFKRGALKAAAQQRDAYEWTCNILDTVPDDYMPKIYEAAHRDDWFAQVFGVDAETQRHYTFLKDVRDAVLARHLVAVAAQFKAVNKSPEETARQFIAWLSPDAHDAIYDWTDPENWKLLFEGIAEPASGGEASTQPFSATIWLEQLRLGIDRALGGNGKADLPAETGGTAQRVTEPATAAGASRSSAAPAASGGASSKPAAKAKAK